MVQTKTGARSRGRSRSPRPAVYPCVDGNGSDGHQYDRRLSDKILAAFNHAYASGAHMVAERLRTVLEEVDHEERRKHDRRSASAVSQADLWVSFIEARNGYNELLASRDAPADKVESALESMKDAYRVWAET